MTYDFSVLSAYDQRLMKAVELYRDFILQDWQTGTFRTGQRRHFVNRAKEKLIHRDPSVAPTQIARTARLVFDYFLAEGYFEEDLGFYTITSKRL
jgi:hypothetical protein